MFLDEAGVSHGEIPQLRRLPAPKGDVLGAACSWQYQALVDKAEGPYVFTCEGCGRLVCYCGGHGCEVSDDHDYCDDCCPCGGTR